MWCKHCRQDVPGLPLGDSSQLCCARCAGKVGKRPATDLAARATGLQQVADHGLDLGARRSSQAATATADAAEFDDWALDFELQRMQRLVKSGAGAAQPADATLTTAADLSAAIRSVSASLLPPAVRFLRADAPSGNPNFAPKRRRRPSLLVWGLLSLGLMAFACGGVLLGWSLYADRTDLWTLGMPIALGGQLGLLLGLLLQLDRLGDDNRRTSDQLETVDQRLDDLKQTATLLSTTHSAPSQAFYSHMAGAANPQLLLADLKGQLDLLAVQVASR